MNICIVNCFDTWECRADLLYDVMREAGNNVKVLCSDFMHIEKKRRIEGKQDYRFFTAEPYKKNISINRIYSHTQLSKDIFGFVRENVNSIDLLWVFSPPNSFIRDAAEIKKEHPRVILIFDMIDLWPETMPLNALKMLPVFYMWRKVRNKRLKYGDVIITECRLYKKVLGKVVEGLRVRTLYLAHEEKKYIPNLYLPEGKIGLCYLGSINNIIDIDCISNIVRQCRKRYPVIFHIIGNGERKEKLIRAVKNAGAEVVYHGKIYDREKKQQIFDSCHYGLNIMKKSVCVGLTMKSIDYFEFGLPIINNIKGDTWNAVEEYGIGINYRRRDLLITVSPNNVERKNARNFFEQYLTKDKFRKEVHKILISVQR